MDKEIKKVRRRMALKRFFTNKTSLILTAVGVSIVVIGLIFLSWAITGGVQKVLDFLGSPLAYFWYFAIIIAVVTAVFTRNKNKMRWRK